MSAIAQYLKWDSIDITGSDRLINVESTKDIQNKLVAAGCRICKQDGSGITEKTDALVVSTAIEDTNPDIKRANSLNVPVFHRSDVLAAIVLKRKTIAVAGTSGKSTVAALVFHLLQKCRKKPSLITGANLNELISNGMIGNAYHDSSDLLVIEADESDGSLVKYRPYISIFLNLSKDHKPVEETLPLFQKLAEQSEHVVINGDDTLLKSLKSSQPFKTFGWGKDADFSADKIVPGDNFASIKMKGTTFTVPFPGLYMAQNLLAAVSICKLLGCDETPLADSSSNYKGIQRRFDCTKTVNNVTVIDDYAHNPEKLNAAIETVQSISNRVIALFQPHGFGPTKFLFQELVDVFRSTLRKNDTLFLLPIYYAGGTVNKEMSSSDIAKELHNCKAEVFSPQKREDALPLIVSRVKSGDVVISMGARDPSLPLFAKSIAEAIDSSL
jgi:UDP-N-acetylmuramate--alanine ligase